MRSRLTSLDGVSLTTLVFRVRCPSCRLTTTLLPDVMLPFRHHSLETIGNTVAVRLDTGASFRQIAARTGLPDDETLSTVWGHPEAPWPWPSTICRWFGRFTAGATSWWEALLPAIQAKLTDPLRPPEPPPHRLTGCPEFDRAWSLLWLLRHLLHALRQPLQRWPQALLWAPRQPQRLDHSRWFLRPQRAPP